jgi:hypothetical protein
MILKKQIISTLTIFFIILLLTPVVTFAEGEKENNQVVPSSKPFVKGPSGPPPTVKEMNDLKRKFGHERYIIDDRNFIVKI